MRWLVTGAIVATLAAAAAASAQGAPSNVDVAWSAPLECPSRAAVLGEVRAILEGGAKTGPQSPPPSASTPHPVDARAVVTRTGQGWHVELAIRSDQGSGERSLDADSCAELASAVALIVALAVDPTRRAPPLVADAAPAVEDAAPPAPDAGPPAPPPRAEEAEADGPRLAFGGAGAADFGALPSAAVGGAVSMAGLYRRARLEARGRIFASQRTGDPSRPAQGVDLSYLGFDARACFAVVATGRAARDGVAISPCLGVDVSRLSGNGFAAGQTGQKTLSGNGVWLGAEGGLLGTWALGSIVALRVGVDLLVPTSRPAFVVLAPDGTTAASLHRPAPVGGRVDLGAELRFW